MPRSQARAPSQLMTQSPLPERNAGGSVRTNASRRNQKATATAAQP
jgi:hypothetical protein